MKKLLVFGLGAAFSVAAFSARDMELTAPMETKSGLHRMMSCANNRTGDAFTINSRETTAVWRPFGANSWEFNDAVTGQERFVLERDKKNMSCKFIKYT